MPKVFISYRRDDSQDITGRIYDRLSQRYGRGNVVLDEDAVPIGVNFRDYLFEQVKQCDVLLVIIGRTWITVTGTDARRRLDAPHDYVRIEIESAVKSRKPVIPVLVGQANMPDEAQLPQSLAFLVYINAARVSSGSDFDAHAERLMRGIDGLLSRPESSKILDPKSSSSERKKKSLRRMKASAKVSPMDNARDLPSSQEAGTQLLEELKQKASALLPTASWRCRKGWWVLGSDRGFHLLRIKATRNVVSVRIRKNESRRMASKANSKGWILEDRNTTVRDRRQLNGRIEAFQKEWL
jgi:hypothetical protein